MNYKYILFGALIPLIVLILGDILFSLTSTSLWFNFSNPKNKDPEFTNEEQGYSVYTFSTPQSITNRVQNYLRNTEIGRNVDVEYNRHCYIYINSLDKKIKLKDNSSDPSLCSSILRSEDSIIYKPTYFDPDQNFKWEQSNELVYHSISEGTYKKLINIDEVGMPALSILSKNGQNLIVVTETRTYFFELQEGNILVADEFENSTEFSIRSLVKDHFSKTDLISVPQYIQSVQEFSLEQDEFIFDIKIEYSKVIDTYNITIDKNTRETRIEVTSQEK
jgi:hypothetical protein